MKTLVPVIALLSTLFQIVVIIYSIYEGNLLLLVIASTALPISAYIYIRGIKILKRMFSEESKYYKE